MRRSFAKLRGILLKKRLSFANMRRIFANKRGFFANVRGVCVKVRGVWANERRSFTNIRRTKGLFGDAVGSNDVVRRVLGAAELGGKDSGPFLLNDHCMAV